MGLDRRQFFRRLVNVDKDSPRRIARYTDLETYTRMHLLPYDFELVGDQERILNEAIRALMSKTSNEELFSSAIYSRLETLVEATIAPWRGQTDVEERTKKLREIRAAAPDYVTSFLAIHAGTEAVEQLKETYGIEDMGEMEALLKRQIETWICEVDDRLILQHDVISIQDLVFAQVRSWC